MGSSSKGGSGAKQYNVFGSLAGVVTLGQVDELHAILVDGKEVFTGPLSRPVAGWSDLTASIDAKYFASTPPPAGTPADYTKYYGPGAPPWPMGSTGWAQFYWGTDDQPGNEWLVSTGHPYYKGVCYLALRHFLFGRERYTAPEIKVVIAARPGAPTEVITLANNYLDDGQINPVASLVELLTSPAHLALPLARLDVDSFTAAQDALNAGPIGESHRERALTQCAPLVASQEEARNVLADLLSMCDGVLRWRADGKLQLRLINWGEQPDPITTLDARHFLEGAPPKLASSGLDAVPSSAIVSFTDRDKKWKESAESVPNLWATALRGDTNPLKLSRPHVTRREQAALIGAEAMRQNDQPRSSLELTVRAPCAVNPDGSPLLPGDKVLVDLDPEPVGAGLAQLCVVVETSRTRTGPVKLKLLTDTLSAATPYSPAFAAPEAQDAEAESLPHALAVPLPLSTFGPTASVALLAHRPDMLTTGFRIYFDNDDAFPEAAELGRQTGFACRCLLTNAITATATTARLALADGEDAPDAPLAGQTPETLLGARANTLLLVLANADANGRIVIGPDGRPELEFVSIQTRVAVDSDTHDYTVLRGRLGLPARAWTASDSEDWPNTTQAWILPLINLTAWRHPDMEALRASGGLGYFRLAAYTPWAEDDADPLPTVSYGSPSGYDPMPKLTWTSPAGSSGETDASGDITVEFSSTDKQGDLVSVRVESRRWTGTAWADVTVHLDETFAARASDARALALNFAGQAGAYRTYELTVTVGDAAGNQLVATKTISRPATSGSPPPPPTFLYGGGYFNSGYLQEVVELPRPAPLGSYSWVEVHELGIGAASPGGSPDFQFQTDVDWQVDLYTAARLWVRYGEGPSDTDPSGVAWSPWVSADYYFDY